MKTFEFPTFRIAVDQREPGVWLAQIEAPGARPVGLATPGRGPEEMVAADLIRSMRLIFKVGVQEYVRQLAQEDPEFPEEETKKSATALFMIAQAAGGDEPLAAAEEEIMKSMVHPQMREMWEPLKALSARTYEFKDVKILVKGATIPAPGVSGFYFRMEVPGVVYEDLIQRPQGYLLAQIAWEQLQVMKRILDWGLERSVDRWMEANYWPKDKRAHGEAYMKRLERVAQILGPARIDEISAALKAEAEKEAPERAAFRGEMEERSRAAVLEELEERARQIEARIKEIKDRREARGEPRPGP